MDRSLFNTNNQLISIDFLLFFDKHLVGNFKPMLVLGIDPGLATVGYAIVKGSKERKTDLFRFWSFDN